MKRILVLITSVLLVFTWLLAISRLAPVATSVLALASSYPKSFSGAVLLMLLTLIFLGFRHKSKND